jgi:hypothetical protein
MTRRVFGPSRGRRRRRLLAVPVLLVACAGLFWIGGAQAVHDTGAFELDGNATNNAVPGDDWDNVCHQVTHSDCSTTNDTTGATAVSWVSEPNTSASIFTVASKDPNDVSTWSWKDQGVACPIRTTCSTASRRGIRRGRATFCSSAPTGSTTAATPSRVSGSSRTRSR